MECRGKASCEKEERKLYNRALGEKSERAWEDYKRASKEANHAVRNEGGRLVGGIRGGSGSTRGGPWWRICVFVSVVLFALLYIGVSLFLYLSFCMRVFWGISWREYSLLDILSVFLCLNFKICRRISGRM